MKQNRKNLNKLTLDNYVEDKLKTIYKILNENKVLTVFVSSVISYFGYNYFQ